MAISQDVSSSLEHEFIGHCCFLCHVERFVLILELFWVADCVRFVAWLQETYVVVATADSWRSGTRGDGTTRAVTVQMEAQDVCMDSHSVIS